MSDDEKGFVADYISLRQIRGPTQKFKLGAVFGRVKENKKGLGKR